MSTDTKKNSFFSIVILIIGFLFLVFAKYGPAWSSLSQEGTITLAIMAVMALFWVLEPIPIYATALLPLAAFPLLQVDTFQAVATPYANQNVYLFLGGFVLALAMEATGLHKRLALSILTTVGTKPSSIIAGFIIAPGLLSMWISNTATAVLMMPIAFSVLKLFAEKSTSAARQKQISIAVLLSIAFSSSMGGMATFIGTPPNAIFSAFARDQGIEIGFGQFMLLGAPIAIGGFIILWLLFTKILFKLGKEPLEGTTELLSEEKAKLSTMSVAEKIVFTVFICTASLWILRKVLNTYILAPMGVSLSDPGIAIISALLLFMLPNGQGGKVLEWKALKNLPWGILILFGGGLALGSEIQKTGVGSWIAEGLAGPLAQVPLLLIITLITLTTMFISQFASNTATTAAFLPIFFPLAQATNIHPLYIMLPLTLGASAVFMLPSATPPNAIVLSDERLTLRDMVKYGGIVNIVFAAFVILVIFLFLNYNIGFDTGNGTFEAFSLTQQN